MLADRAFRRMGPAVERKDQAAARRCFADISGEQNIAGHLGKKDMKFACKPDRFRPVASLDRTLALDVAAQGRGLRRREAAGEPLHDEIFELAAHVEHVVRGRKAWARDRRALVALLFDQPFARQARQRAADQRAADAEALTDRVLGQLVARQQGLLDDGAAQSLVDRARPPPGLGEARSRAVR